MSSSGEATQSRQAAAKADQHAATATVAAVQALVSDGVSLRDAAALLGVSYQRVHQLRSQSLSAAS